MRKDALFHRYELFVAAAVLAAHANQRAGEGFRQRDVKFLVELFSNWIESSLESSSLELQNTQVSRYLEALVGESFAKRLSKGTRPSYVLTRLGLIELTSRIVNQTTLLPADHLFFVHYFIHNYRPKIIHLVQEQGAQFPTTLKVELEALLDWKSIVKQQLTLARREQEKLQSRIQDAESISKLARELFTQGARAVEVAEKVEGLYPYSLNSRKPFSELFAELPPDTARWELEVGSVQRAEQIWIPTRTLLESYMSILRAFANK